MQANQEWYVARGGEVTGPLPMTDVATLAARSVEPVLVWTQGLDGWIDAREVDGLRLALAVSPNAPQHAPQAQHPPTLKERARRELVEYAVIAVYLYVCFGALILYKTAILNEQGVAFAPFGFAAAKALILGKFLLLLQAAKIGNKGIGGGRMAIDIARNALLFALLLIVLAVVEELVVGRFHGRMAADVLGEMTGHSVLQVLATALLMVLVLVPYFAFHEITRRLGEGSLRKMLLDRY